jgi:DNA polymerase-3 subunit delta'
VQWLARHGVEAPHGLLAAAGGQPQLALEWAREGIDAATWAELPAAVRRGQPGGLGGWPVPRVVDALQKLCHDAACVAAGAAPRYFPAGSVARGADVPALLAWMRELERIARHAEHPWNASLLTESLVQQGQRALGAVGSASGRPGSGARGRSRSD